MLRTLKYTALLFAACICLPRTALADPAEQALFWAIDGDGGRAGYLLGTIHSEDPRVLEFNPEFLSALAACDVFAMELVPDLPNLMRLQEVMQLPADQSLSAILGEQRFNAVSQALAGMGVGAAQTDRLKPWAAMISLSIPPPKTGQFMDYALSLRASGSGLRVAGLESVDQQLAFLENLGLEGQLDLLDNALAEFDQVAAVHTHMVDTYLGGDLEPLWREALGQMQTLDPGTRSYFLDEGISARNDGMLASALALLEGEVTFIAVGALHLVGERGLVQLLRNAGYVLTAQPLPFANAAAELPQAAFLERAASPRAMAAASNTAPQ
jgi:uncharacterized protein YbaP (TraB family)